MAIMYLKNLPILLTLNRINTKIPAIVDKTAEREADNNTHIKQNAVNTHRIRSFRFNAMSARYKVPTPATGPNNIECWVNPPKRPTIVTSEKLYTRI